MKHITIFLCLFVLTNLNFTVKADKTSIDFVKNDLEYIKERARTEGKPFFVDFMANWCMPCRWMDETTFVNPEVIDYVDENYLAAKVNIDDFDGYNYKKQYNIKLLPSVLVFDQNGRLLAQYEESLGAKRLLEILELHLPKATAPSYADNTARPKINVSPKPVPEYSHAVSETTINNTIDNGELLEEAEVGELFRLSVSRQKSEGFAIQTGVYSEYENVLKEIVKLESAFKKPIFVYVTKLNNETVYKVLIGGFKTEKQAQKYKAFLKSRSIDGFVKNLAAIA